MHFKSLAISAVLASFAVACGSASNIPVETQEESTASLREVQPGNSDADPPKLGLHLVRSSGGQSPRSPNLIWHNGAIMTDANVTAIFWGTQWANPNSTFVGDKFAGIDSFYTGLGGTKYAGTCDEYSGTNGKVQSSVGYNGHVVDTSAAPTTAPSTSAILAEVCKAIAKPVADGYYPVYTDLPRGNAGYCAWHSYGTCNGVNVQFGFFFDLDNDPGCDPQDTSGLHSQGLSAIANVSGHELSEARTDPRNGGWYDSKGNENADKCAWTFGASLLTFSNGSEWKVQGNWSNAAYNSNAGYTRGCINGN